MNKRCTNCGKFPFCGQAPKETCSEWTDMIGDCVKCELGCGRLEDLKFKGTYRCSWKTTKEET